jgi:predicted RNA-binding Zn-ribbon protein involved in translation (DUF1610 family)
MSEPQASNKTANEPKGDVSPAMKYYLRNKANPFPCPECGRMTNKSIYKRHTGTQHHRLAVLLKQADANKDQPITN